MVKCLVDTDILSFYFRRDAQVVQAVTRYLKNVGQLNISMISYYEVIAGLKFKRAQQQLKLFEDFVIENKVIGVTKKSAAISGDVYTSLRQKGVTIGTSDTLIAGIAIENNLSLVTNNRKHYDLIEGLVLENWKR